MNHLTLSGKALLTLAVLVLSCLAFTASIQRAEANGVPSTIDVSPAVGVTSSGDTNGDGYYERDPQLLIASDGTWWVTYSKSQTSFTHGGIPDVLMYDIYVRSSTDGGATWSAEMKVLDADAINPASSSFRSSTIVEADSKIWVIGADVKGLDGDIYANTYSGGAWSGQIMIFDGTYSTGAFHVDSVAEGNDIRLFYGIQEEIQGVGFIKYHGDTHTWDGAVTKIDASAGYQIPRVIKAGSTYYMVTTNWDHIVFTSTTTPDIVPWPAASEITNAPSGGGASDPTILKYGNSDGSDDLIVFWAPWYGDESQPIEYVYSTDAGATWSSSVPFTDATHGSQVSWDMMPRAYLRDTDTVMLYYGMEQRGINRGQGDIVVCTWSLSSTVGHQHYTTIQDGIDAAASGDIVNVAAGTYVEAITINKPLTLTGEEQATTFIDGGGTIKYAIKINVGPVIVEGFTLRNIKSEMEPIYIWVHAVSEQVTIQNNHFIGLYDPDMADHGVYVEKTDPGGRCIIQNNEFERMWQGVLLELAQGSASILNNKFHHLIWGDGEAPYWGAEGVYATTYNGEDVSELLEINGNEFYDYRGIAIAITGPYPDLVAAKWTNVEIKNNIIATTGIGEGFEPWPYGITLTNGMTSGDPSTGGVNNVVINGNTIASDGDGATDSIGIRILGPNNNIVVTDNTIAGSDTGILVAKRPASPDTFEWYASNLKVHCNSLVGNTMGVQNNGHVENVVDATMNWWGDPTGPYHPTSWTYGTETITNPSGGGDRVSDYVLYNPWKGLAKIDIKPDTFPNSINLKSKGVVPVALLGSDTFDVSTVNLDTVLFAGAAPVQRAIEDVNGDGYMDIVFHFSTKSLTELLPTSTSAALTGTYTIGGSGLPFLGTDTVNIVSK